MIKKTSKEDYEALERLEKECFPMENWSFDQIVSHQENQDSLLYFPENAAMPVGYLLFRASPFEIEILRIGVLPSFRRVGIAEKLLDFLDELYDSKEILLDVKSENLPAIELYKKKGFINFAVRRRYYPDGKDAILMKKECK